MDQITAPAKALKITARDFQAFAQKHLSEAMADPTQFPAKMKEIFDFATANEALMDAEANAYFDRMLNGLADMFEHGLRRVATVPTKESFFASSRSQRENIIVRKTSSKG